MATQSKDERMIWSGKAGTDPGKKGKQRLMGFVLLVTLVLTLVFSSAVSAATSALTTPEDALDPAIIYMDGYIWGESSVASEVYDGYIWGESSIYIWGESSIYIWGE